MANREPEPEQRLDSKSSKEINSVNVKYDSLPNTLREISKYQARFYIKTPMKNHKALALLTFLCLSSFLSSCDPVVDYEKAIVNASSSELLLVRNSRIPFDDQDVTYSESILLDSVLLQRSGRQLLTESFDIGGSIDAYVDCPGLQEGDSIFAWVGSQDSRRLALTITQTDFAGKHRELSKNSCECVFEITDDLLD